MQVVLDIGDIERASKLAAYVVSTATRMIL